MTKILRDARWLALFGALLAWPVKPATAASARRVATWLVYSKEPGFDRIQKNADILASLSVFGDPPASFIARCHSLGIQVYHAVGGGPLAFDTPAHARATLSKYIQVCNEAGYDGIDLDFEHLDPGLKDRYSDFLRRLSSALHRTGKKLSQCVGYYPDMVATPPKGPFYDPKVVARTCDLVRLMAYDQYFAPSRCKGDLMSAGVGPTSSYPWTMAALSYWLRYAPRKKLVLGLPAYSNDYAMAPCPKGAGRQVSLASPQAAAQKNWLPFEKVNLYTYQDAGSTTHLFYASDADSTRALLEAARRLGVRNIGFWHFSTVDPATWETLRAWLEGN